MKKNYEELTDGIRLLSVWQKKLWLRYWRQLLLLPFIFVMFCLNNPGYSQQLLDTETTVKADFGIDGDVWSDILSFYTGIIPEAGTDDWFEDEPDGNTTTGAGVIDVTSAEAIAEIAKISAGQNVGIELRMSAPVYTVPDGNGTWVDAAYVRDQNIAGGNQDITVFDQKINKNYDDPRSWGFKEGDVPGKCDIIDVYGHIRRQAGTPDDEWAMFGASTADADGSNHVDFEYYRKRIDFVDNHIVYEDENEGGDCGHTAYSFNADGSVEIHGDVLLSVDYTNGGVNAEVTLLAWIDIRDFPTDADLDDFNALPNRPFDFVIQNDAFAPCTNSFDEDPEDVNFGYHMIQLRDDLPEDAVFTQLNDAGPVDAPTWGTIDSKGKVVDEYPTNTFVEFAVNATALGFDTRSGDDPCVSTLGSVVVKSRSSASFTSALKDMGGPFDLGDKPQLEVFLEGGEACEGDPPVVLTADLGNSPPSDPPNVVYNYLWEKEGPVDTWTTVGGNSETYSVPTNVVGDFNYRVTVEAMNGGVEGCTKTSDPAMVSVYATPDLMVQNLDACEEGTSGEANFNLFNAVTSDGGGVLSYHATEQDAIDSTAAIDPAVVVSIGSDQYWIRSSNPGDGDDLDCFDYEMVTLTVWDNPDIEVQDLDACEEGISGVAGFNLFNAVTNADGGSLSYHATEAAAIAGTPTIDPAVTVAIGDSVFWIRSTNQYDGDLDCHTVAMVTMTVFDNPDLEVQDLGSCEEGISGVANFNLANAVTNADDGSITYHKTAAEADAGTPTIDPAVTVAVGDSSFWIRSTNQYDGELDCYTGEMVTITVDPNPVIQTLTGFKECDNVEGTLTGTVTMGGSEVGVNYQLRKKNSSDVFEDYGPVKPGTGSSVVWSGLPAGTYDVMAENAVTECGSGPFNAVDVIIDPLPDCSNITPYHATKWGVHNGAAKVHASGGTPFDTEPYYLYSWYTLDTDGVIGGGAATDSIWGLAGREIGGITYYVDVTDANGCVSTCPVTIYEPAADPPDCEVITEDALCDDSFDGWAKVDGPKAEIYTYEWYKQPDLINPINSDFGLADTMITALDSGTYRVVITDTENGLSGWCEGTVGDPDELILSLDPTDLLCFDDETGEIEASWTGGTGPFDVYLDGVLQADHVSPVTLTGLDANVTYTVRVVDAHLCEDTETEMLSQPDELILSLDPTDLLCFDDETGEIEASWTGGTGPFDLYLDGVLQADHVSPVTLTGLDANVTYTVRVVDAHLCEDTETEMLSQPDELILSLDPTDLLCFDDETGEIEASWTGGTGPFDLYLDGVLQADHVSPVTLTGLDANVTYTVRVVDAHLCEDTETEMLSQPDELILSLDPTDLLCFDDETGEIEASWTGGTGPFDVYLDGVLQADHVSPVTLTGLDANVTYTVRVVDAHLCEDTETEMLSQPDELILSLDPTDLLCFDDETGEIEASWTGGTGPFDVYLDGVLQADHTSPVTLTGLDANVTYTVRVVDAHLCEDTETEMLSQPDELILSLDPTDLLCFDDETGEIEASWTGGTGPFDLYLDGVLQADHVSPVTLTGLDANVTYTVRVVDAHLCEDTETEMLSQPDELILSLDPTDLLCFDDETGEIEASWTGGTGPFDVYLDGVLQADHTSPVTLTGLDANVTYTVRVVDAHLCEDTETEMLSQPDELILSLDPTDLLCFDDETGEIEASWTGGTGPFDVYLDGVLQADHTSPVTLTGLDANVTYTVRVVDAHLCEDTETEMLSQPDEVTCSTLGHNSDCDAADGWAEFTIIGGTPPYYVSIDGAPFVAVTTLTWDAAGYYIIPGLAGSGTGITHTVDVKDVNDCPSDCDVIIYADPCDDCNTAFGYYAGNSVCFMEPDGPWSNWGWSNFIPGYGTYDFPFYAGTPVCVPGEEWDDHIVGNVHIVYNPAQLKVTYELFSSFTLEQDHVWVGVSPTELPEKNAPGQWPYHINTKITGYSGPIYVIAHGVVCGPPLKEAEMETTIPGLLAPSELKVFPNPFNERVTFEFVSGEDGHAVLELYNLTGQRIERLLDRYVEKGVMNKVDYVPTDAVSGIYIYKLTQNGNSQIGRVIYQKQQPRP